MNAAYQFEFNKVSDGLILYPSNRPLDAEWLRKGILSIFNARSRLDFIVPPTRARPAAAATGT
jgi:hypothetical protein